jgi:hypothetical protein
MQLSLGSGWVDHFDMVGKPEGGPDPMVPAALIRRGQSGVRRSHSPFVTVTEKKIETPRVITSSKSPESPEWSVRDASLLKRLLGLGRESVPNTPFEPEEREDIRARLQELKEQLKETQDTQELAVKHLEALEKTLKEMREASEASERIGRKDWALLAIGALTTLVISVALPPAAVVTITKLFIHKVAHLFGEELAG